MAEFSGSGDDITDSFKVASNWEIRWRVAPGKPFAVELLTGDDTSRGQVVDRGDKNEGATFVSEEGEFKLKVSSGGEWSIQVISRPVE